MTDIKIAGDWKDVNDTYVKVNGDWKKTTAQYIKINGIWINMAGAITLKPEQYYYEAKPEIKQDLLVLSDIGQLPQVDAKLNGSFHIHLGAGQSIPYPVLNNGGSNSFVSYYDVHAKQRVQVANEADIADSTNLAPELSKWVVSDRCTIALEAGGLRGTNTDGRGYIKVSSPFNIMDSHKYVQTATLVGDTNKPYFIIGGSLLSHGDYGTNTSGDVWEVENDVSKTNELRISWSSTIPDEALISNVSTKEVLLASSIYNMTIPHSGYATHTKALTTAELAEVNAGINVMAEVWDDGRVLVDGFKRSDMVDYFMGNEGVVGGAIVHSLGTASDVTIVGYTNFCRPAPTNHGTSNFLLEMNGIRVTGIAPVGQLQGGNDGRNIQVGTDIHLIKDCVTVIKGDDPAALIEVDCTPAPSTRIGFSSGFSNGFK